MEKAVVAEPGNGSNNGRHASLASKTAGILRAGDLDRESLAPPPYPPPASRGEDEARRPEREPSTDALRIYIAGAHSTGKTTLARWIARSYGIPLVTEVARAVLAELELPLETLRVDLERTKAFQKEVFRRQAEMERLAGPRFVSDRTFDNLAYACHHTLGLSEIAEGVADYARRLRERGSLVFFVRPHRDLLKEDGVRASVSWEEILRIDGMVKLLLELHDIDYITIDTLNMAERARAVRGVLAATGVRA
ncbi:ATP-binding protein [bacterium]|nr:ATP-binding protein [bacterium]